MRTIIEAETCKTTQEISEVHHSIVQHLCQIGNEKKKTGVWYTAEWKFTEFLLYDKK